MTPRVVVIGLGPGDADLLTAGTLAEIARERPRFLRTVRHPAAEAVPDAVSFDDVYDDASSVGEVYPTIVERLVVAAIDAGEVLYAVPGSPAVAERTVELLRADPRIVTTVVPALSFVDLAWARLGIDPLAQGVRIVDGHRFAVDAAGERGPLLVCQCDRVDVLSDIKLSIEDPPADLVVTVVQRLGLADEEIRTVEWAELDRTVLADHLTSLYIPRLAAPIASEMARFVGLVATLREQCPWDREQTHQSLTKYLLEETYEVLDAIDRLEPDGRDGDDVAGGDLERIAALEEELGDLLFQVVFHAAIAREEGWFDLSDVARRIHDKLEARHPHVFGDVEVTGTDDVIANWETIKAAEKGRSSVLDGIPPSLPALALAAKVVRKAASIGVDVPPASSEPDANELGDRLLTLVIEARGAGIDPEDALRRRILELTDAIRVAEL